MDYKITMSETMVCNSNANEGTCRVCMTTSSFNLKYIYDERNLHIIEKIKFCTGLLFTKGDGYPSQICRLCVRNLSMSHKFKTKCLQSDETFREFMKVKNTHIDNLEDKITSAIQQLNDNSCMEENENVDDMSATMNNVNEEVKVENSTMESKLNGNGRKEENEFDKINDTNIDVIEEVEVNNLPVEIIIDDCEFNDSKTSEECAEPIKSHLSKHPLKNDTELPKRRGRPKVSKSPLCDICGIKFKNRYEYEKHRREIHHDMETWQCEICGKHFVHRPSLYVHMRSHRPPEFACDACQYTTCYKYDLIKHKRIHTGDKLFKCEYCSQAFHNASNLRKHKIRQHEGGDPKFPCPRDNCRKAFHDRTELNFHLDSHDDVKRFKCDVCHIELSRRNHWKKHMLRRHKVLVPPARAGRRRTNILLEDSDSDE